MTGTWATGWATGDIVTAAEFKKSAGAIYDTTLGASTSPIDITSISNTYAHLLISMYARSDTAAISTSANMRFNGDTGANYDYQFALGQATSVSAGETFANTSILLGNIPANTAGANLFSAQEIFIPHYAGSTNNKEIISLCVAKLGVATTNLPISLIGGSWRSNAAINQITLFPVGSFVAGTRVTIHALGA